MTTTYARVILAVAAIATAGIAAYGIVGAVNTPPCPTTPNTVAGLTADIDCVASHATGEDK